MFLFLISPVYAADTAPRLCALTDMVAGIFNAIWPFVGLAVFGMFIYGGVMWLISQGDPQRISKATNTLLWAFIGAVILALVMLIMGTFADIFGLDEFQRFTVFNLPGCP